MGIARLPCKRDYWSTKKWMPYHPLVHELGMTRNRFLFIWRHFHVSPPSEDPNSIHVEDDEIDDVVDDSPIEPTIERIVADQEEMQQQSGEGNERLEDEPIASKEDVQVWFNKIEPLVDHFRNVSFFILFYPSMK
mgnify:FL=1